VVGSFIITRYKSEYTNFIVSKVNDHDLRIAVINGEYHWHKHKDCDELFYVLEDERSINI